MSAPGTIELGPDAVDAVRAALDGASVRCRFHGDDFGFSGWERGLPRCESCQQPYRVQRARSRMGSARRVQATPIAEAERAVPPAQAWPTVKGRCPNCGHLTLILADGGHVTCSAADCDDPGMVDDLLAYAHRRGNEVHVARSADPDARGDLTTRVERALRTPLWSAAFTSTDVRRDWTLDGLTEHLAGAVIRSFAASPRRESAWTFGDPCDPQGCCEAGWACSRHAPLHAAAAADGSEGEWPDGPEMWRRLLERHGPCVCSTSEPVDCSPESGSCTLCRALPEGWPCPAWSDGGYGPGALATETTDLQWWRALANAWRDIAILLGAPADSAERALALANLSATQADVEAARESGSLEQYAAAVMAQWNDVATALGVPAGTQTRANVLAAVDRLLVKATGRADLDLPNLRGRFYGAFSEVALIRRGFGLLNVWRQPDAPELDRMAAAAARVVFELLRKAEGDVASTSPTHSDGEEPRS